MDLKPVWRRTGTTIFTGGLPETLWATTINSRPIFEDREEDVRNVPDDIPKIDL